MHTGAQYVNGQPQLGYGPPSQQGMYPAAGLPPGNVQQMRPSMPGQNLPPGQWQPGSAMRPVGVKPMPAMQNGSMYPGMPNAVSGANPTSFNQPVTSGSLPHRNQTPLPPAGVGSAPPGAFNQPGMSAGISAFNQPGVGQMPLGAFSQPALGQMPQNAQNQRGVGPTGGNAFSQLSGSPTPPGAFGQPGIGPTTAGGSAFNQPGVGQMPHGAFSQPSMPPGPGHPSMSPASFGQVPNDGFNRPPMPQIPKAGPGTHRPLENEMESMHLSGGDTPWQQTGQVSNSMQATNQPRQGPPPQMWEPQPGQRPQGLPSQPGNNGPPNFPGPGAPPPNMYNVNSPSNASMPVNNSFENQYSGQPILGSQQSIARPNLPPPPMGGNFNQRQLGPSQSQQPPPPPVNPGPQTMMNMGFGSPAESPTMPFPGVAGQMPPPPGPQMYGQPGTQGAGQQFVRGPAPYGYSGVQQNMSQPAAGQPMGNQLPAANSSMNQSQRRKLDPDHMPSPIQVMEDDRRNHSGIFQTGLKGTLPPLVTTNFVVEDQGMCSPRFLRSTMYNVPCTHDILKQTHLPFAITLMPFAQISDHENPLPLVDLGQMGPVRCNRCKAYMSPYMVFTDGGRKFQCSFCTCNSEVPPEYFNHLDHTGRRIDCYDRPELSLGAYEFVATSDYCKDGKLPLAPAYIFMIDVSYQSIKSGLVNLLCSQLKDLLNHLPKDAEDTESEIRVGFVTYSNALHFYNIKSSLAQPQMLVVSDVQDVFVPLLDGFLVKLSESDMLIDMLMSQIAEMFADSRQTEVVLGPVIQAGLDALRSSNRPGKLFIFHSSLPSAEAPGKLKGRDDRNLLGTDKEKTILSPQSNFYTKLGQECVAAGCSVDLFLFPNAYIDVATVSEVSRLTGGKVHKYSYFQADLSGEILIDDLRFAISNPAAFDSVIRVRTSTGIRAVDFYGNFYMSNTTDVEIACVNSDTSLSVEIKHDDKLSETDGAFVQAAVLYTSVGGRRRLRVLNTAFNTCTQISDMFRSCELDTYVNFVAKHAIRECLNSSSRQVRENLIQQCAQILACYRKNCASPSSAGQLILPECMKLLPLYINCVIKSGILQAGNITTDERSYEMHLVNAMDVTATNAYFYPQLIPLHELNLDVDSIPSPVRCSYERLQDNGVYLLDNGLILFLWIGLSASVDWIRNVLGVASIAQVDIDKTRLQDLDNPLSIRVREIIQSIRSKRQRHMKLVIIRQRDKLEPVFLHYLMEDSDSGTSSSYVDFLCHIHKEIRNLLA